MRVSPAILVLGAGLALGGLMRSSLVDALVFHPSPGIDLVPRQLGIDAEERALTTEDGVELHAFF